MWRELTKKHMLDTKAHFAPDEAMQQYALASEILLTFMGKDWWKEKCTHDKSMMSIGSDNLPLEYRQQFIITNLADCIFLVKDTQNILDWTTKRLHEKDIYSAFCEVYAAKMLIQSGGCISLKPPEFETYDIIAALESKEFCIEVKSKSHLTDLTEDTIKESLIKARTQLPKDRPSIIFLFIPEKWIFLKDAAMIIDNAVNDSLRRTKRVSRIIVCWFEYLNLANSGIAQIFKYRNYINENATYPAPILERVVQIGPSYWNYLSSPE